MTHLGHFLFWWEWVDSNHLSRKTTDLQSAPALQLRRTPRTLFSPISQQTKTARLRFAAALNFCNRALCARQLKFVACHPKPLAKGGAGSGNRTRISSLEGLHTSPCTMPATIQACKLYPKISTNQAFSISSVGNT